MKKNYYYIIGIFVLFSAVLFYFVSSAPKRPLSKIEQTDNVATGSAERADPELRVDNSAESQTLFGVIKELYDDQLTLEINKKTLTIPLTDAVVVEIRTNQGNNTVSTQGSKKDLKVGQGVDVQISIKGDSVQTSRVIVYN